MLSYCIIKILIIVNKGKIMATIDLQGTKFIFCCIPWKLFSSAGWANVQVGVENAHVNYLDGERKLLIEDLENWIFAMHRLLAGAYKSEYNLTFENAGIAVDFYPYCVDGEEPTREQLRQNDCVMAVRLLMRSADKHSFLGGVYTVLMHRQDIKSFAANLLKEFEKCYPKRVHGRGKFVFAGVSPFGFEGCNYWYLDNLSAAEAGGYVWVRMGKRQIEQIVRVDWVRRCDESNAPYDPETVRRILRKATAQEVKEWNEKKQ